MVIPGPAVVTGVFGTSDCSARTAADSWPHPGLVELLNVVNTTPRGRRGLPWPVSDVRRTLDAEMPIMLWTFSVNCVNSVTCTQWSSPEPVIPQQNSATQPRNRHEMIRKALYIPISLVYLPNPGQPRPPGERKDQHRGLQTGEHPLEVSTPQCVTERL
jgi:hypothetical protein